MSKEKKNQMKELMNWKIYEMVNRQKYRAENVIDEVMNHGEPSEKDYPN